MHNIVETFSFTLPIWFYTNLRLKLTNGQRDVVPLDIVFSSFLGDLSLFFSFNSSFIPLEILVN